MAFIYESIWYNLLLAIIILVISVCIFLNSKYDYWRKRGVPYIKPVPFFGNVKDILLCRKHMVEAFCEMYHQLEGHKFGGFFEMRRPSLLVRDPDLINAILVKDFAHFYDIGLGSDPDSDPLSANLDNMEGKAWRYLRYKLIPAFSSGKLRGMFEQLSRSGEKLISYIDEQSKIDKAIDGKELVSVFCMEVTASCAFGIQMDNDSEMYKAYSYISKKQLRPSKSLGIKLAMQFFFPNLARKLGIKSVPDRLEKAIMQVITEAFMYRRSKKGERNDFLQFLLNLQNEEQTGRSLPEVKNDPADNLTEQDSAEKIEKPKSHNNTPVFTDKLIVMQSFFFFVAGFETATVPISFAMLALTQNPKIMNKAQEEIDTILANHGNKWSYEAVREMVYLDQIIQETFRRYTVAVSIFRVCTKTYTIPGTDVVIEEGTRICAPLHAIHNDPKYYPSPETFDPDRFVGNNFKSSPIFMPFGHGPRMCVAMRFAVLQIKVALAKILSHYNVRLNSRTKIPIKYYVGPQVPLAYGGLWFEFDKRS